MLAQCTGAEIVLLRVAVDPGAELALSDPALAQPLIEQMQAETTSYMNEVATRLRSAGGKASSIIRDGPVAATILDAADEIQADVIVMSTHGRTGPARWLMGSVADKIVRNSKVPVMVIRPRI